MLTLSSTRFLNLGSKRKTRVCIVLTGDESEGPFKISLSSKNRRNIRLVSSKWNGNQLKLSYDLNTSDVGVLELLATRRINLMLRP